MNSTPWSASTAQNRSSGLCSGVATNLLDPEGGPPRALRAARPLGRRHPQIRADERQVHAALVVLTGPPERLTSGRTRHRPHSIRAALRGAIRSLSGYRGVPRLRPGAPSVGGVRGATRLCRGAANVGGVRGATRLCRGAANVGGVRGATRLCRGAPNVWGVWGAISGPPIFYVV